MYSGIGAILSPTIYTPEEWYSSSLDRYCATTSLGNILYVYEYPEDADWDTIDIYADFEYGLYWQGIGSESLKLIKEGCVPYEECDELSRGKPQWVEEFLND